MCNRPERATLVGIGSFELKLNRVDSDEADLDREQ